MNSTGRAGRMRVERRLATAHHGAELLDRKQRILADELERLHLNAALTGRVWLDAAREADVWLARAAALDGRAAIEAAAPLAPAMVEVQWGGSMGVAYPEDARCDLPASTSPGASSALTYARDCHRTALEAAVTHAAAERAVTLLSAELKATRTRLRAVEKRWIPRLENELEAIRRSLQELEMEENFRLRWGADAGASQSGRGRASDAGEGSRPR